MSIFNFLKSKTEPKPNAKPGALASAKEKTKKIVIAQLPRLSSLRDAGIKIDASGHTNATGWNLSIQMFFDQQVKPNLNNDELDAIRRYDPSKFALENIERVIRYKSEQNRLRESIKKKKAIKSIEQLTPVDFEIHCANLLSKQGWKCKTTKLSGDQGADVIAIKNGNTLVVQCKLYSTTVGNDAVQQIIAARTYYRADYAVVITNSTYTKSAKDLATTACVVLLNHSEVDEIDLRLKLAKVST